MRRVARIAAPRTVAASIMTMVRGPDLGMRSSPDGTARGTCAPGSPGWRSKTYVNAIILANGVFRAGR
jgi:hypothetical protein